MEFFQVQTELGKTKCENKTSPFTNEELELDYCLEVTPH